MYDPSSEAAPLAFFVLGDICDYLLLDRATVNWQNNVHIVVNLVRKMPL